MKRKTAESVQQQYRKAVEDLESRRSGGKRSAKERTAEALEFLGRPQESLDVVLVGGTNGKGSTVEMISALLQQKGCSTGTFRSPHLHSVRERIKKDGARIDRKDFLKLYRRIEALDPELSFFESLTAMAYSFFGEKEVDYAIMEVGMGGRLDATNAAEPELSVITNIGQDHREALGESREERAEEITEIIDDNQAVLGQQSEVLIAEAEKKAEELTIAGEIKEREGKAIFRDQKFNTPFRGEFQTENLSTALTATAALEELPRIEDALNDLDLKGRMEKINESPEIILDGAHNPSATEKIISELPEGFRCVFNASKKKRYSQMIRTLETKASRFYFTNSDVEWASEEPENLQEEASKASETFREPEKALEAAKSDAEQDETILVTGSIYLIGCLRPRTS